MPGAPELGEEMSHEDYPEPGTVAGRYIVKEEGVTSLEYHIKFVFNDVQRVVITAFAIHDALTVQHSLLSFTPEQMEVIRSRVPCVGAPPPFPSSLVMPNS